MDHEDVLEQLEVAAVEPGGLDRLMAGGLVVEAAMGRAALAAKERRAWPRSTSRFETRRLRDGSCQPSQAPG